MVSSGNRRYGNPIIVHHDGSQTQPKRVSFTERSLQEGWLQELIRKNPEVLPVAEIEPAFAPPVPVGIEVETSVGPIDNMFLSPQGYLTIVETKLWRNPEARREVVGQIIDYAKEVSHWTFDDLENRVRGYNQQYRGSDKGLIDTLRLAEDVEETEEQFIIDAVSRNLKQGRFLLLIVGDGIRESVEEIVDFLQQNPQLLFTLALVELQVHELDINGTQSFLIVPQTLARTREITRAVVKVEDKAAEIVRVVGIDNGAKTNKKKPKPRRTLTAEDFFDTLRRHAGKEDVEFAQRIYDDMNTLPYTTDWVTAGFMVYLPDPGGSGKRLTLLGIKREGVVFIGWGWLRDQLRALELPGDIALDFAKDYTDLFRLGVRPENINDMNSKVPLSELRNKYKEFTSILQRTVDRIIHASNQAKNEHNS